MSVSKLVEKIDADVFLESLSKLDSALKDILSSSIGGDLIEKIIVKYEVDLYHLPDLMMLFGLYVTKLIAPQEFIDYLVTFVPQKYFPQFLQELEDKLWSPYDVYLNKAGVVYKQLTKLTPRLATNNQQQVTESKNEQLAADSSRPTTENIVQPSVAPTSATQPSIPIAPQAVELSEPAISNQSSGEAPKPIAEPKPLIISDLVSVPGIKQEVQIPTSGIRQSTAESGQARVKFDAPRVGPQIFRPTESAIMPEISGVEFTGPESKPEITSQMAPASSQWQRPEEKKVEIPRPPEVKKTEVSGRQVIDLTNFGLSKPDED